MTTTQFLLHMAGTMNAQFMVVMVVLIAGPCFVAVVYIARKPNRLSHEEKQWEAAGKAQQITFAHEEAMAKLEREYPEHINGVSARSIEGPRDVPEHVRHARQTGYDHEGQSAPRRERD